MRSTLSGAAVANRLTEAWVMMAAAAKDFIAERRGSGCRIGQRKDRVAELRGGRIPKERRIGFYSRRAPARTRPVGGVSLCAPGQVTPASYGLASDQSKLNMDDAGHGNWQRLAGQAAGK